MSQILYHSPGQTVTILLETLDGYIRADSATIPNVNSILFPNLTGAAGYPKPMTRISTGLYIFSFTLPQGATAVGTYIADVSWVDPATASPAQTYYQIVVTAPFGNYTVTTG